MNFQIDPELALRYSRWEDLQADARRQRRRREQAADSRSYPRYRFRRRHS